MKSVKKQVENDTRQFASDCSAIILSSDVWMEIRRNIWGPIFHPVTVQIQSTMRGSINRTIL